MTCPDGRGSAAARPLTSEPRLARAAQAQADFISSSGEVTHDGPDGSTPRDRAAVQGVKQGAVTEIVYLAQRPSVERAVTWWVHSDVHCAILADDRYDHAGVAVRRGPGGTAYVVVLGGPGE